MNKSKNEFIARHLGEIQTADTMHAGEKFKKLLATVLSESEYQKAATFYDNTHSVSRTLAEFNLSTLSPDLLDRIIEVEKKHDFVVSMSSMSKLSSMAEQVFSLMKMRLSAGLTYAMALTGVATIVFYIISSKVLPQFEEIFSSFGADLPALTNFAISWQNSYFPPVVFIALLAIFVLSVLIFTKDLRLDRPNNTLKKIPFINHIFKFIDAFTYLSEIKLLAGSGMTMKQMKEAGFEAPASLAKIRQYAQSELEMAEELNKLETEVDYQLEELALKAENIVISSTRSLIGAVMTLVIMFVAFVLIASYLPIFQLGSAI